MLRVSRLKTPLKRTEYRYWWGVLANPFLMQCGTVSSPLKWSANMGMFHSLRRALLPPLLSHSSFYRCHTDYRSWDRRGMTCEEDSQAKS